ncbi:hypothetical protein [Arthrobacter sp. UYCo732]|uniref:hypothetical protein n=1 Tax=Arthrobacter sp. UYCo732 TaxID=3156336 RepID=UPI00339211F1
MTEPVNTQPAGTRTFQAFISVIAEPHRRRTVVMLNDDAMKLPLSDVEIALGPDELFLVTSGNGETSYYDDLDAAWWSARRAGCESTPDAIRILSPLEKDGIKVWNLTPVHQRAVSVTR